MSELLEQTVSLLDRLISYPTISTDSNLEMIADLAERLKAIGARVDLFHDTSGGKANLFATLGPNRPGGIVLSGHTDVVPVADQDWTGDPFTMRAEDGRLFGRGTCDMKGFIAAAVAVAGTVNAETLRRPLHFSFTHDEETGCLGAQALIPQLLERGTRPAMAIIGEPTGMQVIEGHKGCCEYTTRFSGLEGHGSAPDQGVNAAEYAARYALRLMGLRDALVARAPAGSRFDPPGTTINIGRISGGAAHNVIAGKAELDWEMRPVQAGDADFVKSSLRAYEVDKLLPAMQAIHPEAGIETEVIGEVAGLEPMDDNAARDLVMQLTGANGAGVVPFGTEAGLFQHLGASVVVCGPGHIEQAHKPDEFVSLEQLGACLAMLGKLVRSSALTDDVT